MRWGVINRLIKAYGCTNYLEIGVQKGVCFNQIRCKQKTGVDPMPMIGGIVEQTSDEFFADGLNYGYDIVFIDGLHESDQVERDIVNAWKQGAKVIVLHDCNPESEITQQVPRITRVWYGDVWRAFVGFRLKYPQVKSYCHKFDCGVGVIICSGDIEPGFTTDMPYKEFDKNREQLLNLI